VDRVESTGNTGSRPLIDGVACYPCPVSNEPRFTDMCTVSKLPRSDEDDLGRQPPGGSSRGATPGPAATEPGRPELRASSISRRLSRSKTLDSPVEPRTHSPLTQDLGQQRRCEIGPRRDHRLEPIRTPVRWFTGTGGP
jgi:hypothetical protein